MPPALRLKSVHLHILLVLLDGPRHGYGIVKDIDAATGGELRLEPGNLYRYVGQLERDGLVARANRASRESEDERRRYFQVTDLGREAVASEVERMRGLVASAEARLKASPTDLRQAT